jgi:aryl-alcohol dehydrogenase
MSDSLAILGHGALVGATTRGTEVNIDIGSVLGTGQTIHMVIEGDAVPQHFIPQLISLFGRGLSPFDKLIQTYDLDQINTAFKDSDSGRTIKPVIVF